MDFKISDSELAFMELVWANEPTTPAYLSRLCIEQKGWSKPTAYTVIKRLRQKGILEFNRGVVYSTMSRTQYFFRKAMDSLYSLLPSPASLPTAFNSVRHLSRKDIDEIQAIIDQLKEDNDDN